MTSIYYPKEFYCHQKCLFVYQLSGPPKKPGHELPPPPQVRLPGGGGGVCGWRLRGSQLTGSGMTWPWPGES